MEESVVGSGMELRAVPCSDPICARDTICYGQWEGPGWAQQDGQVRL